MRRFVVGVALLCASAGALSYTVEPKTCREGGDFIRNAALSRNNGISAEQFLSRVDADLEAIKSLPPGMRWFAQDADDAALLRAAVVDVFKQQRTPEQHLSDFVRTCTAIAAELDG